MEDEKRAQQIAALFLRKPVGKIRPFAVTDFTSHHIMGER